MNEITSRTLWLDDIRRPPSEEWLWAKTVDEAISILAGGTVIEASLDHDLHPFEHDGIEVLKWMEENQIWPYRVRIHTDNRFAATKMCNLLERNGYCRAPGRPRSFVNPNGTRMSNAEFVAISIKNPPKTMERLRRADEGHPAE